MHFSLYVSPEAKIKIYLSRGFKEVVPFRSYLLHTLPALALSGKKIMVKKFLRSSSTNPIVSVID
jgi:hypothetical protein